MADPLPELPTRDFLSKNFRKPDLQKRCRELGLTNVWTSTKTQLIEMIIEKSRQLSNDTVRDSTHTPPLPSQSLPISNFPPTAIVLDIDSKMLNIAPVNGEYSISLGLNP